MLKTSFLVNAVHRIHPTLHLFLATALCAASLAAQSIHTPRTDGRTPPRVLDGTAVNVGHYEPTNMLRLAFALTPPHPVEERQFLEDVQDKQSPLFHQFLSAEEWTTRFGPSAEDEQAVVDWAKSQGLTVTHRFDNRLLVDVEAPAGVIEQALQIKINNYSLPSKDPAAETQIMFSNDRDPVIPARLANTIQNVLGLNSFEGMHPASGSGRQVPRPDYVPGPSVRQMESLHKDASAIAPEQTEDQSIEIPAVTPPKSGYWQPTDMFSSNAYDYGALMNQKHCCNPKKSPTHSPRESSIDIAAFGDVSISDINDFQSAFPYLATYVDKIAIDGGYTCHNSPKADDNCLETSLDTEWSLAMANSEGAASDTARVVVYEGSNYINSTIADVYNFMVSDGHARTMSTSWACAENIDYGGGLDCYNSTMQSLDNIFSSMAGQGWTLIAASGDQGSTGNCDDALRVLFPSSDPNVIGAGGTELNEGSTYEVAWTGGTKSGSCDKNGGGGTGGFSEYFGAPSYQAYLKHTKRATPDLSLDAFYGHDVYFNGGWAYVGGTSDVAPKLAGFFAQENAYLLYLGNKCGKATSPCAPLGNALYPIYREAQYKNAAHKPFYDITVGCTTNDVTAKYGLKAWCAHSGYDEATGLGSANMLQLAWAINWYTAAASGFPSVSYTGPTKKKWYNTNQKVSWKIVDYNGGTKGVPGTGIAGFTQGWDSIPSDPGSEPHGGSGNSFYSGPQYVNDSKGCLSLTGAGGCKGGVSQGCHTVHVRGWNNQGMTTGDKTYGTLCYDNVKPTTTMKTSAATGGGTKVTLTATDPGNSTKTGSGVSKTYYLLDDASCNPKFVSDCNVYSGAFTVLSGGPHTVYFFSKDNAGNVEDGRSGSFTVN